VEKAGKEAASEVKREMEQREKLLATERDWERKMYEQKIEFLEKALATQEEKISEIKNDLASALKQLRELAEKVVEGASGTRALATVKEIALEQAKRPEHSGKE
jgi:hypothetical protein